MRVKRPAGAVLRASLMTLVGVALLVALWASAAGAVPSSPGGASLSVEVPKVVHTGSAFDLRLTSSAPPESSSECAYRVIDLRDGATVAEGTLAPPGAEGPLGSPWIISGVRLAHRGTASIRVELGELSAEGSTHVIPGWMSILPPLLAILLAVILRQVLVALFAGVASGAFIVSGYDPLAAILRPVDTYGRDALADSDHASVILFSLLLGGLVALVTHSGGAAGMANLVTRFTTTARRGQLGTVALGVLVFFDDYANTLLVGPTMRPITDRLRVSREKLAFLVDATAAPIASLAMVSSWIGVEVGSIADQLEALDIDGDAYVMFLETLPYRFYPIFMLAFVILIAATGRDFGAMRRAELRARAGKVLSDTARPAAEFGGERSPDRLAVPEHWYNAVVPIVVVIAVCLIGMLVTGRESALDAGKELTLRNIFGGADSYRALVWSAFLGGVVALVMLLWQRIFTLTEAIDTWLGGVKSIMMAMLILILAWSLGSACKELSTAVFLTGAIGEQIPVGLLPAVVFGVAALVSFATGTSWGTMGILFPLVMPLAHQMAPGDHVIMLGAVSSILTGSVWGDHCSPISDTTIMSSMASGCDHVDHVRTQLPYALAVGLISIVVGEVATGLGLYGPWMALFLGLAAVTGLVFFVGKVTTGDTIDEERGGAESGEARELPRRREPGGRG